MDFLEAMAKLISEELGLLCRNLDGEDCLRITQNPDPTSTEMIRVCYLYDDQIRVYGETDSPVMYRECKAEMFFDIANPEFDPKQIIEFIRENTKTWYKNGK